MVNASIVEAMAANGALQHYEQKVVCGHVTTTSGRQVLMHITFNVMSVHKSLLSTSALKRRGVTIIFDHDFDRIIFRNETMYWVSHDCHSYLRVTLANGIQSAPWLAKKGKNMQDFVFPVIAMARQG